MALHSILAQTRADFDMLVWKDGGTDMAGAVAELDDPGVAITTVRRTSG